jgi:hypothetical protein
MITSDIFKYEIFIHLKPIELLNLCNNSFFYNIIISIFDLYLYSYKINDIEEYINYCNNNNLFKRNNMDRL